VYGGTQIARLRKRCEAAEEKLLAAAGELAERMGVKQRFEIMVSKFSDGPGMAGFMRPVILLPAATILGLSREHLEAILAHELAHIRRYDYFVNAAQMLVEALLFYHPAVWWVSSCIRRERELCCDDEAVRACGDSLSYARALTILERMRMATPSMVMGGTDGPLAYRIKRLLDVRKDDNPPSRLPAMVAMCLALACLGISVNRARGQASPDAPGVHVDLGSSPVIHRTPVEYPAAARAKSLQGTVSVEVRLDSNGNVSDARVLSGPDEFRKAVLQSVLSWHFPPETAGSTKVVNIEFQNAPQTGDDVAVVPNPDDSGTRGDLEATTQFLEKTIQQMEAKLAEVEKQEATADRDAMIQIGQREIRAVKAKLAGARAAQQVKQAQGEPMPQGKVIRAIRLVGIDIPLADFLARAQLPVREGDLLTDSSAKATIVALRNFDEHLTVLADVVDPNGVELTISAPGPRGEPSGRGRGGAGIVAGFGVRVERGTPGNWFPNAARFNDPGVTAPVPIEQTPPEYTESAKQAKWQGSVEISIVVDETGKVVDAQIIKPLGMGLDQQAMLAVWNWKFKPGMKNGEPIPVRSTVQLNFRLP
jgi:TonB family protein